MEEIQQLFSHFVLVLRTVTVKNDQEKANPLNHTFINQNTCLNLEGFPIGQTQLKSVFTIQDICPANVRKIIKSLPNKASFGSDEISYRLLKEAGLVSCRRLEAKGTVGVDHFKDHYCTW